MVNQLPISARVTYILGLCSYYNGQLDAAFDNFDKAYSEDPMHRKSKEMKEKADALRNAKAKGKIFYLSKVIL